jgi:spore maturation protein CgeB
MPRRVLCVGVGLVHQLPATYARAFEELGWQVSTFDLDEVVRRYARLGRLGARFNDFVPVEPWVRKANRELLVQILASKPDLVLVVGHASVRVGMLAQVAASCPETRFALVWPDTLLNLERAELECLPLYDLVACYGRDSVVPFEKLGARRVEWIPLAGDPKLHRSDVLDEPTRARWRSEVLFIGGHRPERERSILAMLDAGLDVTVWGGELWRRNARAPDRLPSYWKGRELHGRELANASTCAKVCINLIDPTNFPAANMRFFENFLFDVATVNTACPEMAETFRDGEHTLYASDDASLIAAVKRLLFDAALRTRLAGAGKELLLAEHTYAHRAGSIVAAVGLAG